MHCHCSIPTHSLPAQAIVLLSGVAEAQQGEYLQLFAQTRCARTCLSGIWVALHWIQRSARSFRERFAGYCSGLLEKCGSARIWWAYDERSSSCRVVVRSASSGAQACRIPRQTDSTHGPAVSRNICSAERSGSMFTLLLDGQYQLQ